VNYLVKKENYFTTLSKKRGNVTDEFKRQICFESKIGAFNRSTPSSYNLQELCDLPSTFPFVKKK